MNHIDLISLKTIQFMLLLMNALSQVNLLIAAGAAWQHFIFCVQENWP